MTDGPDVARLQEELARREVELAAARREVSGLVTEIEETNLGFIALHAELEHARHAEAQLAAIVQSSDDAIYSLDLDCVVQTWNPSAERLLGYRASEIIGERIEVVIPDRYVGDFQATVGRIRAGEPAEAYETRRLRKDGTELDVFVTLSAVHDTNGELVGISAVLRDIGDRLRTEGELARARADREVLAERDRIARDLHDHVIQRVFAAGMGLQAAMSLADGPEITSRLQRISDDLDGTIADIRTTIFDIKRHDQQTERSLRGQILALAEDLQSILGFRPAVRFHGPIEFVVPADVGAHAIAVVREALSNVARHAQATSATLTVSAADDFVVEVQDDGQGIGDVDRRSGLANLRERAELLGGSFEVTSPAAGGTLVRFRVPISG